MHVVDLSHGSLEVAALRDVPALELRADDVEPDELATALAVLRDARGLKALRLRSRVRALPPALTELRGLQQLELVDDELPGLPAAIAELTRLRSLRLELFHLASLPRSITALTRLRELYVDSHHLARLPDDLGALQELRALTLLLRHVYLHDWERPAHFAPRFEPSVEALFRLLSGLPRLSSLTLGEPGSCGYPEKIFNRLPAELGGLQALEELTLTAVAHRMPMPHGIVMPGLRRLRAGLYCFDATEDELRAMFPNAVIGHDDP
ncbi:hypothetical protein SAMN02745121_07579 [Nannocystis exedens]|uniref:Disease resistance R13L4/SHOC-2-like LRR domain-containing protein n=1 Tax=Nannocystis exedens TaxID=54 RepID=A0A1I2GWB6_9BACT|nr:leucine-rich repeat domain-containing protein [Nannocystis exedens]PCC68891.1 Leucine Rich repeats (2 copies) [Nannocystis exedens]SFF22224.1 hypothetical protein SAMN02745121_07579 [Nannocystis exedens]